MKTKTEILNEIASGSPQSESGSDKMKFWNFVDNGDTAELQLFGTIQSEEDWWSEDCVTYRNFISELNGLGDKKIINVMIQSGGGDVFAANAIYNALVLNKATINGTILGICASAATIILMACEERRIAPNAILMVHNPSVTLWGSYQTEDLLKLAEVTEQVKKSIMTAYMERLDKTEDEIDQLMNEETWYVGQEAVDAGFCDSVVETGFQNIAFSNRFIVNGVPCSFKNYMEKYVPDEIRKKVQALSVRQQKEIRTFFNTKNNTKKGNGKMDEEEKGTVISDVEQLRSAYPELCARIATEAVAKERERLKAIDEIANGIPEGVLMKARYEEPVSAAELALVQMRANNAAGQQFLRDMTEEMKNSGTADVGAEPNTGYDLEGQKKAESMQKAAGFAAKLKKDKRREKKE